MRNTIPLKQLGEEVAPACPGLSCRNRTLRWVRRRVKNADDAEDICSEICLHCLRGLQRFRGEAEFETWLHRIMRNVLNDFLKTKGRLAQSESFAALEARAELQPPAQQLPDIISDSARTHGAICRLNPRQRHLIEWKYGDGLTIVEIAARMHISEAAASQALYRARQAFKKAYAVDEGNSS